MQIFTVIKLLLLLTLFNLPNISGQDPESNFVRNIISDKLNSNLKRNQEKLPLEQNTIIKIKHDTKITNTSSLVPTEIENKGHTIQSTTSPSVINYNNETLPKCPLTFTYYSDKYTNPLIDYTNQGDYPVCYLITKPTPFPPTCPYPTTFEYYYIMWYTHPTDQQHWAYTYRNVSAIGKQNCLIRNGTSRGYLTPTSCSNKYPGVCAYKYDNSPKNGYVPFDSFNGYCQKRHGKFCISDDFKSSPTCYCKYKAQQPRNKFCKKLVEIKDPYVNNIIIRLLSVNESCWIGLQKEAVTFSPSNEKLVSYKWSSTNTSGKYTFWSRNLDAEKTYGAIGRRGWILEEDGALACAICEMEDAEHTQVHIHIKYIKSSHFIEVKIENTIKVFQSVSCFSLDPFDYKIIDLRYHKEPLLIKNLTFSFTISGYYWCEALQISNSTWVFSNTIFIASTYGHEYALLVTAPEIADISTSFPKSTDRIACNSLTREFPHINISIPIETISYNESDGSIKVLCHIQLTHRNENFSFTEEFEFLSKVFKNSTMKITNLTNVAVCISSITNSGSRVLKWPETLNGVTTIPEELCLQEDGSPVTRTCSGNFDYGSSWLDVKGTCAGVSYSKRTHLLDDLLKSNTITSTNLSITLLNVIQDTNNVTSFEIYLISKSLEKLADFDESLSLTDITMTINSIMHLEPQQLRDSQEFLNSTDSILYSLDEMLARTETNDYKIEVTEKLVIQISDLNKTKINGIKLEKTENGFEPGKVHPSEQNINITEENLELAMIIPEQLHNDIVTCSDSKSSPNLIITVFYDDVLFNERNNNPNYRPVGRTISVVITNFDCPFTAPLQVIFNTSDYGNAQFKCASWNYGFKDCMYSTYGEWFIEGEPKTLDNSSYQVCEFQHVTHFTLLVMGNFSDDSLAHTKVLDIITAIGSGLSILGLTVIFLTAILFKSFRSTGTVILLNFSIAITAKIVLLFLADNLGSSKMLCIIFGAALHYTVLSQFCWMLTIAIFQYKRYVVVFKDDSSHLAAKICLCAWGIPLIPVIIILLISPDNYGKNSHGLCYALGHYFIFAVLVPIGVIIIINIIVFIIIIISSTSPRPNRARQENDTNLILQIKLAILLFFLLGLTWGFGLIVSLKGGIVFSYLFCITATLQGFVLFLYFIVFNEKTRSLWLKLCCTFKNNNNKPEQPAEPIIRDPRYTQHTNSDTHLTPRKLTTKK